MFDILADEDKRNTAFNRDIVGKYSILLTDLGRVRETLERLSVDTYDWRDNPNVKNKVKRLAEAEYNAGGSDRVLLKIDEKDDVQLKQYLKQLVRDSITSALRYWRMRVGNRMQIVLVKNTDISVKTHISCLSATISTGYIDELSLLDLGFVQMSHFCGS